MVDLVGELDAAPVRRVTLARAWWRVLGRTALLPLLVVGVASWAWPLYAVGLLVTGRRPPVVPRLATVRAVVAGLLRRAPAPGVAAVDRAAVAVSLAWRLVVQPCMGLAWWLDELLDGPRLAAARARTPLIELSAARSGSTQLARYLEADPGLVAPSALQVFFPYRWLWRLVEATVGRWIRPEAVQRWYERQVPPGFLARHEAALTRTDSLDPQVYTFHLVDLLLALGPDTAAAFTPFRRTPANRAFWEEDFVGLVDGVTRRLLVHDGGGRRVLLKGHFLPAADALARAYPDAVFVTVLRDPQRRVQSVVNFHREQPGVPVALTPWSWLVARDVPGELTYNDEELRWFTRSDGPRRIVVAFDHYVKDLPGTLRTVYALAGGACVPREVPATHARRDRTYDVDLSLDALGVDLAAFDVRSAAFRAWMGAVAAAGGVVVVDGAQADRREGAAAGA